MKPNLAKTNTKSRQTLFSARFAALIVAGAVFTVFGGCSSTVDSTSGGTSGSTGETSSSSSGSGGSAGSSGSVGGAGGSGSGSSSGGGSGGSGGAGGAGGAGGSGGSGGGAMARRPMAGEVIFTELMPNPDMIADTAGEWLEMRNLSNATLELAGCRLKDKGTNGDDHPINVASLTMLPDAVIVMAKTKDPTQNGGIQGVAYEFAGGFALTNTGDEVLLECDGVLIDEVLYTAAWPFTKGVAMQLASGKLTAMDNNLPANWCLATANYAPTELGTPGTTGNQCP